MDKDKIVICGTSEEEFRFVSGSLWEFINRNLSRKNLY